MNAMIPYGLINITNTEFQRADPSDGVESRYQRQQVLHMFWKVHDVAYKTSQHVSDARSRNLFWRTWSNKNLSGKINTSTLTAHWNRCRGEIDLSPFEINITSGGQHRSDVSNRNWSSADSNLVLLPTQQRLRQDAVSNPINRENVSPSAMNIRTEPAYIDISQLRDLSLLSPTESNTTDSPTTGRPRQVRNSSYRNATGQSSANNRSRGTNRGRGRPAPVRRKSSQGNSQTLKPPKSPVIPSRQLSKEDNGVDVSPSHPTSATTESLSPSSWEDDPAAETKKLFVPDPSSDTAELQVEPGFRSKFAERVASTSNLVGMNRIKKTGSVVRFADENIARDTGTAQPLSTTFEEEVRPRLPHRPSTSSVAVSDDEIEEEAVRRSLHRTASSLSMALAEERRTKSSPNDTSANEQSQRKDKSVSTKSELDELLAMGRTGGVTKAGGIQVPQQHRLKEDLILEYSSSESELNF